MSKQVSSIKQAFTHGSGIADKDMVTLGMTIILGLLFVIAISVMMKRLAMFRKDQDAFDVLKATMIVIATLISVLVITQFVII